jgi:predicted alpha/beta-hydrolase family hydrolase
MLHGSKSGRERTGSFDQTARIDHIQLLATRGIGDLIPGGHSAQPIC